MDPNEAKKEEFASNRAEDTKNSVSNSSGLPTQSERPKPFRNPVPDTPIGHVSAKQNGVKIGREENLLFASIHPKQQDTIQVGDYVRIPYYRPDEIDSEEDSEDVTQQLLASVQSLAWSQQFGLDDEKFTTADSFGAEEYSYLAELEPIATINLDMEDEDEPFSAEFVSKPPHPTVRFDTVNESEFLRTGLEIPRDGIYIGDMAVNGDRIPDEDNPLEYFLFNPHADNEQTGEPSIFRHVLVAGSTGTGKTHTSKNILRQFAECPAYEIGIPHEENTNTKQKNRTRELNLTIIDPEEEYAEMADDPKDEDAVEALIESRTGVKHGGLNQNTTNTDFEVYAPTTQSASVEELKTEAELNKFGIPFEVVADHYELMMPNDPGGPTAQAINEILGDYFRAHANPTYNDFRNWLDPARKAEYAENKFSETIIDAAERRLKRSEYSDVFDHGVRSLTDESLINEMFNGGQVSVITTGHLRGLAEELIIQAIMSHIVENKISSNIDAKYTAIKGTPLVLALDEAHEYVDEPETTREQAIVQKFRRAARRGRKDKFGLYFITQNPEDIDGDVRNQLNTKIYLQLDRRVANSPDVYTPPEFTNQIPNFDKGQMVVVQPDVRPVEVKGLDKCLTLHDS